MRMTGTLDIQKKKQQAQHDIFFNKKIVAPQKLKILVLSGNQITSQQLQFIPKCINLLKLDLSNNNITRISPKLSLERLFKLQILYLHHNKIENTPALQGVFSLPKLTHLTIRGNPIQKLPRIEHIMVNLIPTLKVLGDRVIFVEERSPSLVWDRATIYLQPQISEGWKVKDNTQAHYIKILELQLKYFNNVWVRNNPVILIQRAWRQKLRHQRSLRIMQRNKMEGIMSHISTPSLRRQNTSQVIVGLRRFFYQWKQFTKNRKSVKKQLSTTSTYPQDKIYLTYPLKKYKLALRNLRVERIVKKYVADIRRKIFLRQMAERIYNQLSIKHNQFSSEQSFFSLCNIAQTKRFYFNKIQSHLLQNFLIHMGDNFGWHNQIKKSSSKGPMNHYLSIRTVDPETYAVKKVYSILTYSIWPSMRVVFLKRKRFQSKHKTGIIKIKPLCYIKNINKVLPPEQYKKSCQVYKQLQNFHRKQYENTLDYFQCKNDQIMKMLLRYIYYHNSKLMKFEKKTKKNQMQSLLQNYTEPFMVYVENILQRTAAAVRIQQNWRKYLTNKRSKQSIYEKMKKTRAALRIQRFWRDRVFYHRISYQRNISYQLRLFNSNSLIIPCEIYMKFQQICRSRQKNQLYQGLKIIKNDQFLKGVWKLKKPIYPPSIAVQYFYEQAHQARYMSNNNILQCDQWNILHFKSNITRIQYGQKLFYQFKFDSVEQTRFRIYLISLFSYRCKHSRFFLPISRDTLDLISIRLQEYKKLGLISSDSPIQKRNKSRILLKNKDEQSFVHSDRIGVLRNYKNEGVFLNSLPKPLPQKTLYSLNSQFYQKIFQDHPKKEVGQIFYYIDDQIRIQKQLQRQKIIQSLIQEIKIEPQSLLKKYSQDNSIFSQKGEQSFMSITKIDKKRLSFYDIGARTQSLKSKQIKQKPKTRGQFFYDGNINKRQNISRVRLQTTIKKQQFVQRKTQNLKKIRQNIEKQRQSNMNVKNKNQIQRNQQLRKKVQRIRQMKSRVSSLKKQEHQQDFIQQGNFVMQQQLKMVIMKSRMQSIQPKKKTDKSETSSQKNNQSFSKSFYTQEKNKEIKIFQNSNVTKQIAQSLGATLVTNNPNETSNVNVVEGQQRKIVNMRNHRRSKSRSIGAYIRDPSLVHGVFPEQYYPIDNKQGGNFKFFPPLV